MWLQGLITGMAVLESFRVRAGDDQELYRALVVAAEKRSLEDMQEGVRVGPAAGDAFTVAPGVYAIMSTVRQRGFDMINAPSAQGIDIYGLHNPYMK